MPLLFQQMFVYLGIKVCNLAVKKNVVSLRKSDLNVNSTKQLWWIV